MVMVGFNFTKLHVEKLSSPKGKIKISNNVTITNVLEKDLSLGKTKEDGVLFEFEFSSKFNPGIGDIILGGEILYMEPPEKVQEIMKSWAKDKKLPQDFMTNILNNILVKCNIEALILSQTVNLPPPIPLPKVSVGEEK
jgi:hypothetical protein